MMSYKYLYIFLPLLLFSSCNSSRKTDLEEFCLKNKVKSVTEIMYAPVEKFGKVERGEQLRLEGWDFKHTFTTKGYLSETVMMKADGSVVGKTKYEYLTKDSVQKRGFVEYDSEETAIARTEYKYEKGSDDVAQEISVDSDGNIRYSKQIELSDGKRTTSTFSGGGKLISKLVEILDKRNYPSEVIVYGQDNELSIHYKEHYNKMGLRDTTIYLDTESDGLVATIGYTYDVNGNLVHQHGQDASGPYLPKKFVYEFDEKGNWITCIEYNGDEPATYTERFLEYY